MSTTDDEKVVLTLEEAKSRLPVRGEIHTFRQAGFMLVGADWSRRELLKALRAAPEILESGPQAQGMNHGLVIEDDLGFLFIQTRPAPAQEEAPDA